MNNNVFIYVHDVFISWVETDEAENHVSAIQCGFRPIDEKPMN